MLQNLGDSTRRLLLSINLWRSFRGGHFFFWRQDSGETGLGPKASTPHLKRFL